MVSEIRRGRETIVSDTTVPKTINVQNCKSPLLIRSPPITVPGVPVEQLELRQAGLRRGPAGGVGGRGVLVDGAPVLQAALRGREGASRRRRHSRLRRHREIFGEKSNAAMFYE